MCTEFSPLSRSEAQNQVDALIRHGLSTETASGIELIGADILLPAAEPATPAVEASPAPVPSTLSATPITSGQVQTTLRSITKNGPAVVAALDSTGVVDIQTIAHRTGLSVPAVRYALKHLINADIVGMVGGQGQHNTGYQLRSV